MVGVKARIGVLISGRGSNLEALLRASRVEGCPWECVVVVSNKPDALGLNRAEVFGVETAVLEPTSYRDKGAYDRALAHIFLEWACDWVVCAGFMRILTPEFLSAFPDRVLNIHPSLLPKYKGLSTHRRVLEAGDLEHGCTVHIVTEGVDEGPILAQARVLVLPGETEQSLADRVLEQEHLLYPQAVTRVVLEARGEVL